MVWEGLVLGGHARICLYHADRRAALEMIVAALAEIDRLEGMFSLHRSDSLLVQLNRMGVLEATPPDLRRLLAEAMRFNRLSGGAFDVSVQPLWDLYAAHFADPNADPAGPRPAAVAESLTRVGASGIVADPKGSVRFARPGMALIFNGIAQGYITDRVADVLRMHGATTALLCLGETLALGARGFSVGIADPRAPAPAPF